MTEKNNHTNQLPKDWKWVKLGEAVQVLDNLRKPINSSERQKRIAGKSKNELFPYYGATGQVGWIDNFITDDEYILLGEDGAPFLDHFKEKAYKINGKTWVNNHAHILKEIQNLTTPNFILHYLNSINYRPFVNGTTRLKLTKGSLIEIPFPLPPKPTQLAIVSKIEELFSEIENGIKSLFTAKEQLKKYRQSVLKWAFEGKLINGLDCDLYDLPDEHDLSIAAEPEAECKVERNHSNQKNQKNHSSDNGELPEGWKWVILGEVSKVSGGLTKNSKRQGLKLQLPFLRVANVYFNLLDLDEMHVIGINEHEIERVRLKKNDLLFVEGNGSIEQIGRVALWNGEIENCVHQNHLIKSRLSKEVIPKYALYFFCSKLGRDEIKEQANSTSGLHTLSLGKISKLQLPLAPIREQNIIVQAIESRLSVADKMEESITESLQQAEALKQSILKKAFEAKLV